MDQQNNYVLGRGQIFFNRFLPGTRTPTDERYFGHTPEFTLNVEAENLDHWNAENGVKIKDESALIQVTRAVNFVTDNISPDNLALFFLGDASTVTDTGSTAEEETLTVKKDRYYQLGVTASNPAGVRGVSSVVVEDVTPTTYVEGTDYEIDEDLGRLYILTEGSIDDDTELTVTYDIDASTRDRIISKNQQINGQLRFVAYNAVGKNVDYFMAYVRISPNGDFSLKSDEWQQLGFSVEVLELNRDTPAVFADGRPLAGV